MASPIISLDSHPNFEKNWGGWEVFAAIYQKYQDFFLDAIVVGFKPESSRPLVWHSCHPQLKYHNF